MLRQLVFCCFRNAISCPNVLWPEVNDVSLRFGNVPPWVSSNDELHGVRSQQYPNWAWMQKRVFRKVNPNFVSKRYPVVKYSLVVCVMLS